VRKLEKIALVYVEAKLVEKFIGEHFIKVSFQKLIEKFLSILAGRDWSEIVLEVIGDILDLKLGVEGEVGDKLVEKIHEKLLNTMEHSEFVLRYQNPPLFDEVPKEFSQQVETFKRVIFIAKIQESFDDGEFDTLQISSKSRAIVDKVLSISRPLLRASKFYQFTVTPYEILLSYRSGDDLLVPHSEGNLKLKQIPIEYLSDSELLERYVRRINRYGFTQRQEFEEIFMTLLVLLNQWNEMQDAEEQFNIKQLCLQTNVELILSCFRFPAIGAAENSFFHFPRCEKIKLDSVGLKKLHHIQETLDSESNVFYRPNLERVGEGSNLVSSTSFDMNQFALNYPWEMIESRVDSLSRNIAYHHEKCGIDFKSALQLIYDLMTQMIDENPVLVLPNLVKIVDVLDNVDQFKWINRKMLSLYESIAEEDTISHQHIAYLLCRSAAVLIPSLGELQQLQVIVNKYLSCNQVYVRNAALHGLLCLFESLCKTNTTMGGMSDEMKMLRNCIVNYTSRNGIVYER
jgi:huntingtin